MPPKSVAALAAQMAAGSGDSRVEFDGDAGELHERDLSAALPRGGGQVSIINASGATNTSSTTNRSSAPHKLRKTVSSVGRKDQMVKLKAAVLDVLSLLQSMCDDGDNRMKALHRRIGDSHRDCLHELEEFDDHFVWHDPVGFDVPRVILEGRLALDSSWYQTYGMPIRTPDEALVAEKFEVLENKLLLGREADTMITDMRRDVTKLLFPLDDGNIPEIMVALNNFTLTDIIGKTNASLNETRDQLQELNQMIAAKEEELTRLLQNEQVADAEKVEAELLVLTEKRLEITVKRVSILTSSSDDSAKKDGALAQLDQIIKNPIVGTLLDEKTNLKAIVQKDTKLLEEDHVEKLRENESAISRYNHNVHKSKQRISQNHEEQNQKWIQLEQLLKEITELDREGERLTRAHILMTEIEQKRRQEHREYRDSYSKHRVTLDELLANTESAISFTEDLKHAMIDGREKLIAARIEEQLKEALKRERDAYLKAFEAYGRRNQIGAGRCEKRVATAELALNDFAFLRGQCRDTGDESSTAYAKRSSDLERQARKLRKSGEKLEEDFARHESVYQRLERTMLDTLGDVIATTHGGAHGGDEQQVTLHLKLRREKADLIKKFVDQATSISNTHVSAVQEMRHKHMQISQEASTLKESVEQRKSLNKTFRSFASPSLSTSVTVGSPSFGSPTKASMGGGLAAGAIAVSTPPTAVAEEQEHAVDTSVNQANNNNNTTIDVSAIDVSAGEIAAL